MTDELSAEELKKEMSFWYKQYLRPLRLCGNLPEVKKSERAFKQLLRLIEQQGVPSILSDRCPFCGATFRAELLKTGAGVSWKQKESDGGDEDLLIAVEEMQSAYNSQRWWVYQAKDDMQRKVNRIKQLLSRPQKQVTRAQIEEVACDCVGYSSDEDIIEILEEWLKERGIEVVE